MPRTPFFGVLLLMLGCGGAVWLGQPDPNLSFDSARLIWADVLRDADDIGLQLTRVSPAKEMQLGSELAGGAAGFGPEDEAADRYVQAVGNLLAAHLNRPSIQYHFHVVRRPVEMRGKQVADGL